MQQIQTFIYKSLEESKVPWTYAEQAGSKGLTCRAHTH